MRRPSPKTLAAYVAASSALERKHKTMLRAMRSYMAQLATVQRYEKRLDKAARLGHSIGGEFSPSDFSRGHGELAQSVQTGAARVRT